MIAVAGGSGRLGREIVRVLQARSASLRVLCRDASGAHFRLGAQVPVVAADVRQPLTLAAALEGAEAVVSAITGFGPGGAGTAAVDQRGNLNLIRAAAAAGVRHFVLVSVEGAGPDHPMRLMRCKHAAEEELRASGMEWTVVRPTAFAELWSGLVGDPIRAGSRATVFGSGDNPINFVATADVALVVDRALSDPALRGETVGVGGPANVSLNQLVAMIAAALECPASARRLPVPVLRLAAVGLRPLRPDLAGMMEAALSMAVGDMTFDPGPLQARFPWLRLTPIEEVVAAGFRPRSAAATGSAA